MRTLAWAWRYLWSSPLTTALNLLLLTLGLAAVTFVLRASAQVEAGLKRAAEKLGPLSEVRTLVLGAGAKLGEHLYYVWNHVSSAANNHGIPYFYIQSSDFIFIVQCGARDSGPCDRHRTQMGNRCYYTSASNLEHNIFHHCRYLFSRKFLVFVALNNAW